MTPKVLLSGFADEGAVKKTALEQMTLLAAVGLKYYSIRFVDAGNGVKNVMQLTDDEVKTLQQLHRDFGVSVTTLGSPIGKVKIKDVDDGTSNRYVPFRQYVDHDVRRAIALAQAFGTKLIPKANAPKTTSGRLATCSARSPRVARRRASSLALKWNRISLARTVTC
jgi:hypothetical protein